MNTDFLPLMRALIATSHAFKDYATQHIRTLDLTLPQFDVIVTLGNHEYLSSKELGDRTLITKGTLTGILDRLESKQLIWKKTCPDDSRRARIGLTEAGQALFESIYVPHMNHLALAFQQLSASELQTATDCLNKLNFIFTNTQGNLHD